MKKKVIAIIALFSLFLTSFSFGCKKSEPKSINVVVKVEFEDTENFFGEAQDLALSKAFIEDENGLKNFIYKNSNGKKTVNTVFTQRVKIAKPVDYFMPKYEYDFLNGEYVEINEDGYDNRCFLEDGTVDVSGKPSAQRFFREQEVLSLVTSRISQSSLGLLKEDKIENLTIVFSKLNRGIVQSDLYWPHQSKVYKGDKEGLKTAYFVSEGDEDIKEIKLGDKSINSYIFIPFAFISNGENLMTTTLCHEYMHVFGAPDLYSNKTDKEYVGEFDVLGGKDTDIPNLSLSYVRYKLGWISEGKEIQSISSNGEYILYPTEENGEVLAYKITLTDFFEKGESFYIEYRKLEDGSLSNVSADGVIIYRVNEEKGYLSTLGEKTNVWHGNAYFEEVSLFRFWREIFGSFEERKEITKSGICYATVSDKEGYNLYGTEQSGERINAITYSDGTNTKITVEVLQKTADGGIKIRVKLPESQPISSKEGISLESGNRHVLTFNGEHYGKTAYVLYSDKKIYNPKAEKIASGKHGEVIKVSTAFLQTSLPRFDSFEKYVYVFYEDGGVFTPVLEHKIKGIKNVNLTFVLVVAIVVGFLLPSLVLYLIRKKSNKESK